jgi:hypothetical protein
MQKVVGYLLVILGIVFEIIAVLVWLGVLVPAPVGAGLHSVTIWDILLELVKRAPWTAVVGLMDIYAGLKLIGVELPF